MVASNFQQGHNQCGNAHFAQEHARGMKGPQGCGICYEGDLRLTQCPQPTAHPRKVPTHSALSTDDSIQIGGVIRSLGPTILAASVSSGYQ